MLTLSLLAACLATRTHFDAEPRDLFLTNCAVCHGPDGAGDGTAKLDRPARSFADGGFSYGNTEEALFRTITHGIPGTPMPSFGESLTDAERRTLAAYVVSLGPPIEAVATEDTVLIVGDRPLVVRGYLPPIAEGASAHPRGLLIGHPSGLSFEYRVDDVRLLGVRQGGFLERKDWIGRGGSALGPLGRPVWLFDGGDPPSTFLAEAGPLMARLERTEPGPRGVETLYRLTDAAGLATARIAESLAPASVPGAAGFARYFRPLEPATGIRARVASWPGRELMASFAGAGGRRWFVSRGDDGYRAIGLAPGAGGDWSLEGTRLVYHGAGLADFDVLYLSLSDWNDDVRATLHDQ
ncbi:MAG: c-type cytochrome [Planctomycetota bacterium]